MSRPHSCYLVAFATFCSFVSVAYSASHTLPKPLQRAEITALVAGQTLPKNLSYEIATRGIAFHPSNAYREQLKTAGADSSVIAAVDKARVANPNNLSPDKWEFELLERLTKTSVLMNQQQYDKAVEQLTAALDASVASPEAGFVMGAILREQHDWQEAAAVYTEVLREDPQFPDAHTKLSYVFYRLDDSVSAVREAKIALAENPQNAEAHKNAGLGFQIGGKLDAAISEYQEALQLKPDYGAVRYDLGILFEQKHDTGAAIAEYKKAVALEPNNADYHYNLGTVLGNSGETEPAIRELREAKRIDPTRFNVRMNLAVFLERLDMRGAVAEFRELEKIAPDSQMCHKCMAGALYATGDRQGAEAEYRKAAEIDPTDHEVPLALGWLLEQDNKYNEALFAYRTAERVADYSSATHLAVGRVLVSRKDYVSAVPELRKATTLSPSAAEAHDLLGKALAESGDVEGAAAEFKEALAIDPKRYDALLGLARLSENKGDWPQAMEQYRQAAAVESTSNHEDHHGQSFLYSSVAESAYGAAELRFDEHVKSLTAAGKSTDVADLSNRIKSVQASSSDSVKLQESMRAADEARRDRRFADAENSYKQAVELAEKSGAFNEILITALESLGGVYGVRGNLAAGDSTLHRALTVIERTYGSGSPRAVHALHLLAGNSLGSKDFVAAQSYAQRALELSQKDMGLNNQVYESLRLAAMVYTVQNSYDKAQPYLLRAVDAGNKLYGNEDDRTIAPLYALCDAEGHLNNPTETEQCYRRLVSGMETIYGASNPALVRTLTEYAQSLKGVGKTDEAFKVEQRAESIRQSAPKN